MNMDINEEQSLHRLRTVLISTSIITALIYTWFCRFAMSSDGMSYLDMSDGPLSGNWDSLVNPLWSPLYPAILSLVRAIFKPSTYNEFGIVHLANFLIFLSSLAAFNFYINELLKLNKTSSKSLFIPNWVILLVSYALFIQSSINLITLWAITPDILMSTFVFLSSGILIKIFNKGNSYLLITLLGISSGVGYLAKAAMFPLGILILFISIFAKGEVKKNIPKVLLGVLAFFLITSPYLIKLSKQEGHLTFGESGKINYAWYVNNTPFFTHWQGNEKTGEKPLHPTRKIYNLPNIYEFSTPINGTYPPWVNPVYWYKGVNVHFDFIRQISAIAAGLEKYIQLFLYKQGAILIGIILLFYLSGKKVLHNLRKVWFLILPSLFSLFMFSLVHVEERYIAAFLVVFWSALFMTVKVENSKFNKKILTSVPTISAIVLLLVSYTTTVVEIYYWNKNGSEHIEYNIAKSLKELGVKEGDKVATIGYQVPESQYWARVGRFKVVSEIVKKDANSFWASVQKGRIYSAFSSTGAKVLVAKEAPSYYEEFGWKRLGNSKSYGLILY